MENEGKSIALLKEEVCACDRYRPAMSFCFGGPDTPKGDNYRFHIYHDKRNNFQVLYGKLSVSLK